MIQREKRGAILRTHLIYEGSNVASFVKLEQHIVHISSSSMILGRMCIFLLTSLLLFVGVIEVAITILMSDELKENLKLTCFDFFWRVIHIHIHIKWKNCLSKWTCHSCIGIHTTFDTLNIGKLKNQFSHLLSVHFNTRFETIYQIARTKMARK